MRFLSLASLPVVARSHTLLLSLPPRRSQTAATHGWVLPVTDSPKPPPERITLTMPVLNAAKEVIFVAAGEPKVRMGSAWGAAWDLMGPAWGCLGLCPAAWGSIRLHEIVS